MKILIVLEQGIQLDTTQLEARLHIDVKTNSFPVEEGVAIFSCGQTLDPSMWEPDTIIKVGTCEAYPGLNYNARIDSSHDWEPELYELLETQQTSNIEGLDTEEES